MCAEEKQALRRQMRARRAALSLAERAAQADQIAQRVLANPAYRAAETIFCYCATQEEIDTRAILTDAFARGKRVCVPLCQTRGVMTAREISGLDALCPGAYGILEPAPDSPVVPPDKIDLCVIPCLCTDTDGYRLGYGGGYYDRFLAQTDAVRAVLCAEDRVLTQPLPREKTDLPCDLIFTERQVFVSGEK